ncbi:hypothetical protein F1188_11950 [Roseospira marina]|uniref:Uncharacterized protein n=1 Tax=Roseospira marina TaxID=140057 RepID=A0A5M6IAH6_9PROT|nr:hypothetical protein [Roseospira marina]KAA5605274.1 hypothetical protein F1188_11950 [Roseospira marina]MBB4314735.1 hypothetical protein [Roseospira marina]MBB5087724.1 hypothetical protein [Roseospira marina]
MRVQSFFGAGIALGTVMAVASVAHAEAPYVEGAATLCPAALSGQAEDAGLAIHEGPIANPFGETAYAGTWNGAPVVVTVGDQFGNALCEVHVPDATADDYAAVQAALVAQYGADGTIYDKPDGAFGYRGETWADSEAVENGTIPELTFGDMPMTMVMIQYAAEPFAQTNDRAGLLLQLMGR